MAERLNNKNLIKQLKGLATPVPLPDPEKMEQGKQKLLEAAEKAKLIESGTKPPQG